MTPVEFITARLDEDERAVATGREPADWCDRADGIHVGQDRWRREIAGKRAILMRYENCLVRVKGLHYPVRMAIDQAGEYEDYVLPGLAAAWSDHPQYGDVDWYGD